MLFRSLFGWVATKEDCDDVKNFEWAGNIINTMTPGDVYQTLTTRHPSAESRRYLYKVNTAQKSYRRR